MVNKSDGIINLWVKKNKEDDPSTKPIIWWIDDR
jgi:hypothetical protein